MTALAHSLPPSDDDAEIDEALADLTIGITAFMAGAANVIMQLSRPAVGYGVVESKVDSGKVTLHPIKRLRTTLSFLSVALHGSEAERAAYREAVNTSHRQVRSTSTSPVKYNAFDPTLQLWVAACLYQGFVDAVEALDGPLDDETADYLYRHSIRFGTTLQMRPEMWPADRAAFDRYWTAALRDITIDDTVRRYLMELVNLRNMPLPVRVIAAPLLRFYTTGFLPPEFRQQMQLTWTDRNERVFRTQMRLTGTLSRPLPRALRMFPFNFYLWDLRRRMAAGKPLV